MVAISVGNVFVVSKQSPFSGFQGHSRCPTKSSYYRQTTDVSFLVVSVKHDVITAITSLLSHLRMVHIAKSRENQVAYRPLTRFTGA